MEQNNIQGQSLELSVVISALNEGERVAEVLTRVLESLKRNNINGEVVFMNNHSTDNTGENADRVAQQYANLRVIHRQNRPNKDLGSSLREGIANAKGKFYLIMDCDLSHNPDDIVRLFSERDKADIIIGSRFVKGGSAELNFKRWLFTRTYNNLARLLVGIPVKDLTTGFKLYRTELIRRLDLKQNGFGLVVEMPIKAYLSGATFLEIPIKYARSPKESTLNYRKQFRSYMTPVMEGFKERLRRLFFFWK